MYIPYKCADSGLPRASLCWPNGSQYSPVLPSVDPVTPRAEPIQPNVSQSFPVLTKYSLCWPSDSQSFPVLPQFFPVPPSTDPSSWLLDKVMRKMAELTENTDSQDPFPPSFIHNSLKIWSQELWTCINTIMGSQSFLGISIHCTSNLFLVTHLWDRLEIFHRGNL